MEKQIIQFIQNHWTLCSIAAVVLGVIIFEEIKERTRSTSKLSAQDVALLLNRENTAILDTRNQKAFINGHILGAINIAHNDIDQHLKKLEPCKNKTLILVDDQNINTSMVSKKLSAQGFAKIYVLAGGISAWKEAQLPLVKDSNY